MRPKSDNLFHFTKSLEILKLILENGIQPRFCLEDIEWAGFPDKYLAYPMSCFCDIPLSRISEHTNFYGSYGLGLTKNWGLRHNLNPVIYCTPNGSIKEFANYFFDLKGPSKEEDDSGHHSMQMFKFTSLIKPTSGKMVVAGEVLEKEFYQENEWRFVPSVDCLITEDMFTEVKDAQNDKLLDHALKFTPQDIRYIFVSSDNDIPGLVDFINEKLGDFSLNDLKILQSRIVSLETLSIDL